MPPLIPFTQPEQVLENELVAQLVGLGFAKAAVTDEATMLANLKAELGAFNGLTLSEPEFGKVLNHLNRAAGVFAKAKTLRDRMQLKRNDGNTVWISFFDSANPGNNRYQVTQQVTAEGTFKNRYDVTILVNGLPLGQIELKRRGLGMKETRNREFTAMMCVSSVEMLIQYYELLAKRKAEGKHKLKVATIFSYTSNEEDKDADGILDEGGEIIGGEGGDPHTREKLENFIGDYNAMFGTAYSTKDTQSFYNYYRDIGKKVRDRKVDLLLVVNMFSPVLTARW